MSSSLDTGVTLKALRNALDQLAKFLVVSLKIANAHTVDFYTNGIWDEFVAVSPESVLSLLAEQSDTCSVVRGDCKTNFCGFSEDSQKLVDVSRFLHLARAHSLNKLLVCSTLGELLQKLRSTTLCTPENQWQLNEFMNTKKSHEVAVMAEVVSCLAKFCNVRQVIDIGSGKGYLSSYLSMQYGLKVYGIDASSTNTHGANERNRKLNKYSKTYQKAKKSNVPNKIMETITKASTEANYDTPDKVEFETSNMMEDLSQKFKITTLPDASVCLEHIESTTDKDSQDIDCVSEKDTNFFFSNFSGELVYLPSPRVHPRELSQEEKERRKQENLKKKTEYQNSANVYSPLTSYVTAETELQELISEMKDSVMVGLHTCGDLAPSTLRIFTAKSELKAVCSVGCCYHLLSEEFDYLQQDGTNGIWGFPMSDYMKQQGWTCGRNARMSACLALERVTVGKGLPIESLFYRAVLHVIIKEHFGTFKSEKRVGNVYAKATSFVDYIKKSLRKLDLDETKLSDRVIEDYHIKYRPRINEMEAFNMLKLTLAPCIEGLILLDRLCYLKEQESVSWSALVQLFDPLTSPRCYAVIGIKNS
ncbi:methyltransferase-like protein 25 [Polypterus senegalus]|uniref:methyltransferase-like protein 25 n=1 Tax=Polypterus senegalus TaxID=55291 RepID=UPI001965022C|nr:methyltransferase-like protein 25 [Polypterus senegalus]